MGQENPAAARGRRFDPHPPRIPFTTWATTVLHFESACQPRSNSGRQIHIPPRSYIFKKRHAEAMPKLSKTALGENQFKGCH